MREPFQVDIQRADLSQPADLDAAAPLFDAYRQFYGRASDLAAGRAVLAERAALGESVVYLGRSADGVAHGFMQIYPSLSSVSLARGCVLNDLYVSPPARRSGLGRRLLATAVEHARAAGVARLSLSTQLSNSSARALYESAGWVRDTAFTHYGLPIGPKETP